MIIIGIALILLIALIAVIKYLKINAKIKMVIGVILIAIILLIGKTSIEKNPQILKTFYKESYTIEENITIKASSYLNLMPTWSNDKKDNGQKLGTITIHILGINKEKFFNNYDIKELKINNQHIDLDSVEYINYNNDEGLYFIVETKKYKNYNKINMTIKNKNNNQDSNIKFYCKVEEVM